MASTTSRSAPTREIGYAVSNPGNYWLVDIESTPELRWPLSTTVYDAMGRQDSQVKSVLRALILPVLRTGWRIAPNGARDEVVEHVADDLRLPIVGTDADPNRPKPRAKGRFSWSQHVRMCCVSLRTGHMFFEQVYRIDDRERVHLRKLAPRMPRTIAAINVAADGGLVSIEQHPMGTIGAVAGAAIPNGRPIPVSRLVAYVNDQEGGDWVGTSVLRAAYKNWLLKDRLLRVQAMTVDRNGMGVPIYYAGPDDQPEDLDKGRELASEYGAGDRSGAGLPHGAKLRLQGVEGAIVDADKPIRYHDEQIARSALAHFLNLGTQTGSWALGSTFADFFVMSLQVIADMIADVTNMHVIEDLVDLNWGEDEPAPLLVPDEIGSRHDATAEAISLLLRSGALRHDPILEAALRVQYGLPPSDPAASEPDPDPDPAPPAPPNRQEPGDE